MVHAVPPAPQNGPRQTALGEGAVVAEVPLGANGIPGRRRKLVEAGSEDVGSHRKPTDAGDIPIRDHVDGQRRDDVSRVARRVLLRAHVMTRWLGGLIFLGSERDEDDGNVWGLVTEFASESNEDADAAGVVVRTR